MHFAEKIATKSKFTRGFKIGKTEGEVETCMSYWVARCGHRRDTNKYNKEKHLTTSGKFYQLTTQTLPRIPALRLSSYPSTSKAKIAQTLRPRVAVNYQRLVLLEVYGLPEHNNTTNQTINILAHIEHPPGFVIKRRISQLQMDILIDCEVMVFRVALGESFWGNHEGNIIELCLR